MIASAGKATAASTSLYVLFLLMPFSTSVSVKLASSYFANVLEKCPARGYLLIPRRNMGVFSIFELLFSICELLSYCK